MSDTWAVVLAASACLGALAPHPAPLAVVLALAAGALAARRPWLVCVAAALLTGALAERSWAGLAPPALRPVDAVVTLVDDPRRRGPTTVAVVRLGDHRYEAAAHGAAGAALRRGLAGERVRITGRLEPLPAERARRVAWKHVAGRLTVTTAEAHDAGAPVHRAANRLRRLLWDGAASMPPDRRALFTGLVVGDDRLQPVSMVDDFRAAGLSHLSAVSGQNVAFVLAVAGPLLRRLRWQARYGATLGVVAFFALATRFEPSVLRASAMAAVAASAVALARPASPLRVLALAVTGLVVVDPLLVHAVGFQLSVGASLGLAVLATRLAERIPGPAVLAEPLAVTIAAQVGVAPVQLLVFGGLPLASIPANLLAVPAAGPVMMLGLVVGLAAGALPEAVAAVLHVPTHALVAWIELVARLAAGLPLGRLGAWHVAALAVGVGAAALVRRRAPAAVAVAAVVAASVGPAVVVAPTPADGVALTATARLTVAGGPPWHRPAVLTVSAGARPDPDALVRALRRHRVRRLDALVVPDLAVAQRLAPLTARVPVGRVVVDGPGRQGTGLRPSDPP